MKVFFINPPHKFKISRDSRWPEHTKSGTLYYPFWLSYAAGFLLEKGQHEVMLVDSIAKGDTVKTAIERIKKFQPDFLVLETVTPTILDDIKFIEKVKRELPEVKIILTGTHASALPEETMKMSESIDFIARGEYEMTVLELVNGVEVDKIDGLTYRIGNEITHNKEREFIQNLDELPFVSKIYKKFLDVRDYRYALAQHPMIQIWTSRGCPNRCTFCQIPQTFMKRVFRARSPENVFEELKWIKENLPEIKEVFIEDDTFTTDKKRVEKICDLLIKRGLKITWSANVRADLPYSLLQKMKRAGCRMLIVGFESGDQKILNNIKKGITINMAREFVKNARRVGLKIFGCFMIGLPGDTKKTVEKTFMFAKELNPDMAFFQQAVPFPGTEFYEWVKENNYLVAKNWDQWLDKNGQLDCIIDYPWLTREEIRKLRDEFTVKFYLSPRHLWLEFFNNLSFQEQKRLFKARLDYLKYLFAKR